MNTAAYLTASEAAALLGVSKPTLYAYVSRGLLQPKAATGDGRGSLYARHELDKLLANKKRGRKPRDVALSALHKADLPLIETAQSAILDGELYYRGQSALQLAQSHTLEEVARLLWRFDDCDPFATPPACPHPLWQQALTSLADRSQSERAMTLLKLAQLSIPSASWLKPAAQAQACADLLRYFVAGLLGQQPSSQPIHLQLAQAWQLDASAAEIIRRVLVLCADNEINPPCFAGRLLASLGVPLGAALEAGQAGAYGVLIGGGTPEQVEVQWSQWQGSNDLGQTLAQMLERGETLYGFDHPSFPQGDCRARDLLSLPVMPPLVHPLCAAVMALTGRHPNIDLALVALRRGLGCPSDAAYIILHSARLVGQLGHILEQRRSGLRLRPRGQYVGPLPDA